jgi:predicted ATPase
MYAGAGAPRQLGTHCLPAQSSALIGRDREVNALQTLLRADEVRLVSLCGPGGIGKTRLALATAATLVPAFDGVCFVDLAPIADPGMVGPTICDVLGLARASGLPVVEQLRAFIQDRAVLLVLDNMEQVVGAAAEIGHLLRVCSQLEGRCT